MKSKSKILSVILSLCMVITMLPAFSVKARAATFTYDYELTGNTGAAITVTSGQSNITAVSSNTSIATVSVTESTIFVNGISGAVGIATITIKSGSTILGTVEVPVGYTTFIFDGDDLYVYAGNDLTYEIYGISKDSEVETVLTGEEVENALRYSNTTEYSVNVNVKKKGGTYVFSGTSDNMSVSVNKAATAQAELLFAGLDLTSDFTSPVTVKKESTSTVTITALGGTVNTLKDSATNNADIYGATTDGGDGTNAYYAESSVIKCKSYANITLNGTGTLNLEANAKNALKVGEYGSLTIENLTLNITSVDNGISSDNTMTINSGNITVDAEDDAIKADPDVVDETLGCASVITINGGNFDIAAGSDGIRTSQDITITGGTFNIKTANGYNDSSFNSSTMSCKGIKAATTLEDASAATNTIAISGGTFTFNTADDAIHSDAYVDITGGKFDISTGDDGVHASTVLNLGTDGGLDNAVNLKVTTSYEGLEAGTVNIFSGTYEVHSSDDGINAAGGSDSSGGNNGDGFNPGGNNNRPGGGGFGGNGGNGQNTSGSTYELDIYGGNVTVYADGDGLDANGTLVLTGGNIVVWGSAANTDNAPLDCDSTLTINGATVFAAGSKMMATTPSSSSQPYVSSTSSIASGKTINAKYNGTTVYNVKAVKNVNYVIYSSPDMTSSSNWTIVADDSEIIEDIKELEISFKADNASAAIGDKITFTAAATGGKGSYTYSYLIWNKDTNVWYRVPWSDSNTYTWTASSAGNRAFYAEVKDEAGTVKRSAAVTVVTASELSIKASASAPTAKVGDSVKITVTATGGTGSYTYSYLIWNKDTNEWYRVAWSANSTFTWKAGSEGNRIFYAEVKDSAGTVKRSAGMSVVTTNGLTVKATASATSVSVGDTVKITTTATGGTGSYTYSYLIWNKDTDVWYRVAWSANSTYTWKAGSAATRVFYAEAKDSAGSVVRSTGMTVVTK